MLVQVLVPFYTTVGHGVVSMVSGPTKNKQVQKGAINNLAEVCFCVYHKAWFLFTANSTITHKKQSDYVVEQSSFPLVTLF